MLHTNGLTIRTSGPAGSLRRDLLVNDHVLFTTSRDVVRALGLEDGDVVDEAVLAERVRAEEPNWARQRAIRLLNHRDRSRHELSQRLAQDGYSNTTVQGIVERFAELEVVDDSRFAASLVRTKVNAGWGEKRIMRALSTAGIDEATIAQALDAEYPDDDLARARKIVAQQSVSTRQDASRLTNRLIRRGFDVSIAHTVGFERLSQDDDALPDA